MHHASRPGRRTASLRPTEQFVRGMSAGRPKVGSRKTCLLHPTQLGLELSLVADEDDLKFLYETWETDAGHAFNTRGRRDIRGNMGYRFELLCYCISDEIVPREPWVGSPTLFLIHPLWPLRCARITDYGDPQNLVGYRRKWTNANNLPAKLLPTRYPRLLKVRSVLSAHCKRESGYFEQDRAENIKLEFSSNSQVSFVRAFAVFWV